MASRSQSRRQLSRSKVELFLECPRCFFEDVVKGNRRPSSPPFTLNIAVDELFKREFDRYRNDELPHPLFATVGLDAVPLKDQRMNEWRNNFKGVRWLDPDTGWTLCGAIDDLWRASDGSVIVADYKATAKKDPPTAATLYPAYRRQAEIYQYLVAQQGFVVSDRAWFVYANGIKDADGFEDVLRFNTVLVPHDGRREWVPQTFRNAVSMVEAAIEPPPGENCDFCQFAGRWKTQKAHLNQRDT
jgi:hypothetical protein